MKEKITYMNIARGIGVFLVVVGHSFPTENFNNNAIWEFIHQFVYSFHMPLFFFISGFFAIKIYNICDLKLYKGFIRDKFNRLMIPYLVITSMAIPIKLFMNKFSQRPISLRQVVIDTFIYPWNNPIIFFWFIYTLFMIFLISPIVIKVPNKYVILVIAILSLIPFKYTSLLNIDGLIHYSLYFYLGLFTRQHYTSFINLKRKNIIIFFCLVVLIGLNFVKTDLNILSNAILIATSISGIICCIGISYLIKDNTVGKTFDFLGSYSYDIYLFSWFFQTGCRVVFYQMLKLNYNVSVLILICSGFMPIILSKLILNKSKILCKIFLGKYSIKKSKNTNLQLNDINNISTI